MTDHACNGWGGGREGLDFTVVHGRARKVKVGVYQSDRFVKVELIMNNESVCACMSTCVCEVGGYERA